VTTAKSKAATCFQDGNGRGKNKEAVMEPTRYAAVGPLPLTDDGVASRPESAGWIHVVLAADYDRDVGALQAKVKEQECREAICGHDHSTQWWEVRAHNAEQHADALAEALETVSKPDQTVLIEATASGDPWKISEAAIHLFNAVRDIADTALARWRGRK
jgi:hypothetical protein